MVYRRGYSFRGLTKWKKIVKTSYFAVIIYAEMVGLPCSQRVDETISFSDKREAVHHPVEEDNFQSKRMIRFDMNDIFWYSPGSL